MHCMIFYVMFQGEIMHRFQIATFKSYSDMKWRIRYIYILFHNSTRFAAEHNNFRIHDTRWLMKQPEFGLF